MKKVIRLILFFSIFFIAIDIDAAEYKTKEECITDRKDYYYYQYFNSGSYSPNKSLELSEKTAIEECTLVFDKGASKEEMKQYNKNILEDIYDYDTNYSGYATDPLTESNMGLDEKRKSSGNTGDDANIDDIELEIESTPMTCSDILGPNLTKIVKVCITILRVVGAIIALLQASFSLIPAIYSGDESALKAAGKKCVYLAIILLIIGLFPTLLKIIGDIGEFDLTCFS